MIKEHEDIIFDINLYITKQCSHHGKYTIKYIYDEFVAFEIHLLDWKFSGNEQNKFQKYLLENFHDIIKEIYIVKNYSLYIVYLSPIEEIRVNKINKLQEKITYETNNKI